MASFHPPQPSQKYIASKLSRGTPCTTVFFQGVRYPNDGRALAVLCFPCVPKSPCEARGYNFGSSRICRNVWRGLHVAGLMKRRANFICDFIFIYLGSSSTQGVCMCVAPLCRDVCVFFSVFFLSTFAPFVNLTFPQLGTRVMGWRRY